MTNTPNFILDRKASALIAEALRWINSKFSNNADIILNKLEKEYPQLFDVMIVSPFFEGKWHKNRNIEQLKLDLRAWMQEWVNIIESYR